MEQVGPRAQAQEAEGGWRLEVLGEARLVGPAGPVRLVAYQPGTVNLLALSRTHVVAPDPHGPVVDGRDLFRVQLEEALAPLGITVLWVDSWDYLHQYKGEVHCGTNTVRALQAAPWWEAGP
ncbi:MAG: protein-arginine deiminase domain-containing protein [Myxococcaceae bacterium]|nr:protein-arginine deiminase domain-containing protein [Myxococcaceae bacterium]